MKIENEGDFMMKLKQILFIFSALFLIACESEEERTERQQEEQRVQEVQRVATACYETMNEKYSSTDARGAMDALADKCDMNYVLAVSDPSNNEYDEALKQQFETLYSQIVTDFITEQEQAQVYTQIVPNIHPDDLHDYSIDYLRIEHDLLNAEALAKLNEVDDFYVRVDARLDGIAEMRALNNQEQATKQEQLQYNPASVISIGDLEYQVVDAIGLPDRQSTTETASGTTAIWYYDDVVIFLDNHIVYKIMY